MPGKAISHYRIAQKHDGVDLGVVCVVESTRVDGHIRPTCLPDSLVANSHALERFRHEARDWLYTEVYG